MTDAVTIREETIAALETLVTDQRYTIAYLKRAIHGGTALKSTAELLDVMAEHAPTDELKKTCRERAEILRSAVK